MKIVILCGGKGSRLWPLSDNDKPKQLIKLMHGRSGLQDIAIKLGKKYKLILVSANRYADEVSKQMQEVDVDYEVMIVEPEGRNTAGAVCAASILIESNFGPEEKIVVLPSDHNWENFTSLVDVLELINKRDSNTLMTVGIKPRFPETKYGYIKKGQRSKGAGDVYQVSSFKEKPNSELAASYVKSGSYLWNTGIYAGKASVFINELKEHGIDIYNICRDSIEAGSWSPEGKQLLLERSFINVENKPIDKVVSEKSNNMEVYEIKNDKWADLGTFDSLIENEGSISNNDMLVNVDSKRIYCFSEDKEVLLVGLDEVVVMNLNDKVIILRKGEADRMQRVISELEKERNILL